MKERLLDGFNSVSAFIESQVKENPGFFKEMNQLVVKEIESLSNNEITEMQYNVMKDITSEMTTSKMILVDMMIILNLAEKVSKDLDIEFNLKDMFSSKMN